MTKKEIVKTIADALELTQIKTKDIVQKTFDAIVNALVEERRIELRNFGVFEVKKRAARKARNPRTGDKVFVNEKYVVTFKPGKEMEERVRQLAEAEAQRRADQEASQSATPMEASAPPAPVAPAYEPPPPVAPQPPAAMEQPPAIETPTPPVVMDGSSSSEPVVDANSAAS